MYWQIWNSTKRTVLCPELEARIQEKQAKSHVDSSCFETNDSNQKEDEIITDDDERHDHAKCMSWRRRRYVQSSDRRRRRALQVQRKPK